MNSQVVLVILVVFLAVLEVLLFSIIVIKSGEVKELKKQDRENKEYQRDLRWLLVDIVKSSATYKHQISIYRQGLLEVTRYKGTPADLIASEALKRGDEIYESSHH